MSASTSPSPGAAAPSWRKRHPIAARLVLYGLGLALGLGLFAAWKARQGQDREDRVAFLWARLESLPVVLPADPEGPEVLKALDAEYADPALPADLRARAERLRGIVARNRKDRAGVDAAFSRARGLDPAAGATTDLEWALCVADLGDGAAARARMPTSAKQPGWGWAASIWYVLVQAQADAQAGSSVAARRALGEALDRLPRPLPREEPFWFGLAEWEPSGAALEATRWLLLDTGFATPEVGRAAWSRLAQLAHADAETLLACAEGLLALGETQAASEALGRARAADPALVAKALASRPGLQGIERR